jgi:hypothetical protein
VVDFCRWLSCLHLLVTRTFLLNFIGRTDLCLSFHMFVVCTVSYLVISILDLYSFFCLFPGKNLPVDFFLIGVLTMNMKGVYCQN